MPLTPPIDIYLKIWAERIRQEELKAAGKFVYTAADPECPDVTRITMLVEEIGEVARAMQNNDLDNLKEELTQVAAITFAWLEYLSGL